jgi:hypothetical protein
MEGMNRRLGWRPVFKWKRGVVSRDMVRDGGWGCGPLSVWRGLYVLWNINRQKKIMLLKKETIQQYKKWFHLGLECLNLSCQGVSYLSFLIDFRPCILLINYY